MTARIERLGVDHAGDAARVMRAALDDRLPWLAGRHAPAQDEGFFRHVVFDACAVWGAFDGADLAGVMAVRPGWIDQLHVRPDRQGRGFGTALLAVAKQGATELSLLTPRANAPARAFYERRGFVAVKQGAAELSLWTFQANAPARAFDERRGFAAVETTDGRRNEDREPDIRYVWRA